MSSRTVAIDFDGVMNNYKGWKGPDILYGPREGLREFLQALVEEGFELKVYSTRDATKISIWLQVHQLATFFTDVTREKPPAIVYLDDRGLTFTGDFDLALAQIREFKTHWEV